MRNNNPTGKGGYVKGQSGNPAGRKPKGYTVADIFSKSGQRINAATGKTLQQELIDKLWDTAAIGDYDSAKIVLDRTFGRAMEQIEFIGNQQGWDLSKLSEKQLQQLEVLISLVEPVDEPDNPE